MVDGFSPYQLELCVDMLDDELDGDFVLSASRDDDVRVGHQGGDVVVEGGLHHLRVLLDDALQFAAPLRDVALEAPRQPHVGVGVHEDLHVQHIQHLRVVEREDALEDYHVRPVHRFLKQEHIFNHCPSVVMSFIMPLVAL